MLLLDEQSAAGDKSNSQLPQEYVLSALRSGALRTLLIAAEADTIGIGLRAGLISPEAALLWARDAGVLVFVSQDDIESAAQEMDLAS